MRNAFRWKDSVGAWEERPGHYGDVWDYWTDDGFGYFEGLQVHLLSSLFLLIINPKTYHLSPSFQFSEDIGALPIWVFNNGTFR